MGDRKAHLEPREWRQRENVRDLVDHERVHALASETGLSPVTIRVCLSRGLEDSGAIQTFLTPRLDQLTSPFKIRDMDRAVDRLVQAREENQRVRIFGDYDVDGTTGAALLVWIFRQTQIHADATQPDRFKDGYGLNVAAVEKAAADGIDLLVTVDCGITSFPALERAEELGLDVVVVDHHQLDPKRGCPPGVAIVNPQRPDCESGLRQLCGCGLAFYVAMALRQRGRDRGWFTAGTAPNLKQHLDLVVMATAADMVPLTGDNRILVRHGMQVLRFSQKPGVRALMDVAGVGSRDISPGHLGFTIGPRINASGRMQSASLALEMLTTENRLRALELAQTLERLNEDRKRLQDEIWDSVRDKIECGLEQGQYQHSVVVGDESWHEGVVGIVASRVTEMFRKPAIVLSFEGEKGKGSVRSYGGKNVLQGIRESAELLTTFGGHKHAAGLSLKKENFEAFVAAFDASMASMEEDVKGTPLYTEGRVELDELSVQALQEIESLAPFGPGNPEPVFVVKAAISDHRILKDRHLKMNLSPSEDGSSSIEAIWFNGAERGDVIDESEQVYDQQAEWAAVPELNRFRGRMTPTLRIRDWRKMES